MTSVVCAYRRQGSKPREHPELSHFLSAFVGYVGNNPRAEELCS